MFYRFNQNNSYGKFLKPAREVFVEADNEEEALQVAETIEGIYFKGSSDRDCPCCGPRWSKIPLDYSNEEFDVYLQEHRDFMSWLTPSIPQILIRYRDGNIKTIENKKDEAPVDTSMPTPMPMEEQEIPVSMEGEN